MGRMRLDLMISVAYVLSLTAFTPDVSAQGGWSIGFSGGARSESMGRASVILEDTWAIYNNQAGLASLKNISLGLYSSNHYLLKELSACGLAMAIPTPGGVIGIGFTYSGFSLCNEKKIGLAFARAFGKKISAGLQLDYLTQTIGEGFGTRHFLTFEGGFIGRITERITVGFHTFNPVPYYYKDGLLLLSATYRLGVSYLFSGSFLMTLECEQSTGRKAILKSGLEYSFSNKAFARLGIISQPFEFTAGVGFIIDRLQVDLASSYHQYLGYSPQVSVIYFFR
jgi:hypothetical protein